MKQTAQTITLRSYHHYGQRVPSNALGTVLEVIPDAISHSIRMAVEGRSKAKGKRPQWLNAASDIRFLGHEGRDDTVLHFESPSLGDAAPYLYDQGELWPTKPTPQETGFDILHDVLLDVEKHNVDSDRFDRPLLERIGKFRKALNGTFQSMMIESKNVHGKQSFTITSELLDTAESLCRNTPLDQQVRIVGKLDMLRASTQSFGVILDDGQEIRGVMTVGDLDQLTKLLNKRVLVLGKAIYRPSGKLLRVDAEAVSISSDHGKFFSSIPKPVMSKFDIRGFARGQQQKLGIAAIIGKWPSNETDVEIQLALKDLK